MTAPTIEAFLTQPDDDLEDTDLGPVEAALAAGQTFRAEVYDSGDPLESIADSLRTLVGRVTEHSEDEKAADRMQEAFDDLDAKHAELYAVLARVEKIVAKSTSKVSLDVKAAINAWRKPEVPAEPASDEPPSAPEMPAHDADVQAWRDYARSLGYSGAPVDEGNRSQIRTLLGIGQPVDE